MAEIIKICGRNHIVGVDRRGKRQEIKGIIDDFMGDEFAKYVDEYIGELEEKSEEAYWKAHTDEQAYEEELNERSK